MQQEIDNQEAEIARLRAALNKADERIERASTLIELLLKPGKSGVLGSSTPEPRLSRCPLPEGDAMTITERLQALLDAATPGPWEVDDTTDQYSDYMAEDEKTTKTGWFRGGVGSVDVGDYSTLSLADAAFIVTTINALPRLLAVVEAARPAVDAWDHFESSMPFVTAMADLRATLAALEAET